MKFIVHEPTTQTQKVFSISGLETVDSFNKIPKAVGELKGDLIVFRGDSDPSRLPLGQNGQMLVVDTTQEVGVKWQSQPASIATTKGDLVAYKSGGTPTRLEVGTNGQALVADSAQAEGIKWGYPAQLATGRTIQTKLNSTSAVSFNGSANVQPGVTGVLPEANGGTGNTNGNAATATKLDHQQRFVVYLGQGYNSSGSTTQQGLYKLESGTPVHIPVWGALAIDHGGTGATSATDAQAMLGFLGRLCQGNSSTNLDTTVLSPVKVKTDANTNAGLYAALNSNYAYVIQIFYSEVSATSAHLQIAFPYGSANLKMAWRTYYSGAWGNWHRLTAENVANS